MLTGSTSCNVPQGTSMYFKRCPIPEVILCTPKLHTDARGYFMESFRQDALDAFLGFAINFCQDNESQSHYGVVRGLHYQQAPYAQTKLVRVLHGRILDVAVDLRREAPTFGQHVAVVLDGQNKQQLLIPKGFAHGFAVLSATAVVAYKADAYYVPEAERGINYSDAQLNIDWQLPVDVHQLSSKDQAWPSLAEAEVFDSNTSLYR